MSYKVLRNGLEKTVMQHGEPAYETPAFLPLQQSLPERLRTLMEERRIGHRLLSELAGVGMDSVRNILRGRSMRPRLDTLQQVARALDVSVDQLTGAAAKPPAPLRSPPFRRAMLPEASMAKLARPWHDSLQVVPNQNPESAKDDPEDPVNEYCMNGPVPLTEISLVHLDEVVEFRGHVRPFDLLDPGRRGGRCVLPIVVACPTGCIPAVEPGDTVLCQAPCDCGTGVRAGDMLLVDGENLKPQQGTFLIIHHGRATLAAVELSPDCRSWQAVPVGGKDVLDVVPGLLNGRVLGKLGANQ
jgi:transcriptional regulator with XRE-family HTH domain